MAERRLKSLEDVRRYLAYLIRATESGKMEARMGGKLAYISSILLRAIEGADLKSWVEVIEQPMAEKRQK